MSIWLMYKYLTLFESAPADFMHRKRILNSIIINSYFFLASAHALKHFKERKFHTFFPDFVIKIWTQIKQKYY